MLDLYDKIQDAKQTIQKGWPRQPRVGPPLAREPSPVTRGVPALVDVANAGVPTEYFPATMCNREARSER